MVDGSTATESEGPLEGLFVLFYAETVRLDTLRKYQFPALWHQLILMVTSLNDKIVLASFLQDVVERIQTFYYMFTSVYIVYNHLL